MLTGEKVLDIRNMPMAPAIRLRFEKLERQKQTVLSEMASLSPAELGFRPQPSAWCMSDVLDHIVKVEKSVIDAVQGQLPDGAVVTLRDRIGALFIITVMRSPMRVKVPASATMVLPSPAVDLFEAAQRWAAVREEMADLFRRLEPRQLCRGLFRHPVSGWMNMADALAFLSAHLRHHCYQLNRLKSAARKASAPARALS